MDESTIIATSSVVSLLVAVIGLVAVILQLRLWLEKEKRESEKQTMAPEKLLAEMEEIHLDAKAVDRALLDQAGSIWALALASAIFPNLPFIFVHVMLMDHSFSAHARDVGDYAWSAVACLGCWRAAVLVRRAVHIHEQRGRVTVIAAMPWAFQRWTAKQLKARKGRADPKKRVPRKQKANQ